MLPNRPVSASAPGMKKCRFSRIERLYGEHRVPELLVSPASSPQNVRHKALLELVVHTENRIIQRQWLHSFQPAASRFCLLDFPESRHRCVSLSVCLLLLCCC